MNNSTSKSGLSTRAPMPAFGNFGGHQAPASLLLEKSNPGLRRSTPDSEALASSDDEIEHGKVSATSGNVKSNKNARRTSWLNDVSSLNVNRKPSITGPYSPSTSHPGTPGTEASPWTTINTTNVAAWQHPPTTYPWSNIWSNQDGRKEPPARLQEVLPTNGDGGIPFSIPLQPTPKTYRSQSYSVGQLDTTSAPAPANPVSTSIEATRNRLGSQYPNLQRRTSRTSGLSTLESGGLGRLREVEDDEEENRENRASDAIASEQARMIEILEKENAQLRHAAQNRDRTYSSTASATQISAPGFRNTRLRSTAVPEETETAIDDREDITSLSAFAGRENNTRRMSEQPIAFPERQPLSPIEGRAFEGGVKKAHWQTSLGFGPITEAPQSRRHSFADVPTRQGSFSSNGENSPCSKRVKSFS